MKNLLLVIVGILALSLSGCAGTTKKTTTDPLTGQVTVEEPVASAGFFESENLNKYYEFEARRADKHAEVAQKKIDAIIQTGNANMQNYTTPIERAQGGIITQLMVANVPVNPPSDGIAPPKTMMDFNWVGLLNTGLQAYGLIWGNAGDSATATTLTNTGTGSIFVNSNGNSLQDYKLSADGAGGYIQGVNFNNGLNYDPTTTTTETKGSDTYGLTLF